MSHSPVLMRGTDLAASTNADTAERAAWFRERVGFRPTLATVLVGDDPASVTVIAAVGSPRLIRGNVLKDGVIVVDAGYNEGNVGDVDFDSAL